MGININLDLKTLNGQSLLGTGDMTINSINWKGSFASAPLSPAKYDAYHNTSDGSSYIYNGTSWTILAAKGADGSSGSSGMFFPHDTLTSADVGKLVIWKDGKAQLPVFEPAVPGTPKKFTIDYVKGSYDAPTDLTRLNFKMTTMPTDNDQLMVVVGVSPPNWSNDNIIIYFKDTPSNTIDVQIGVNIEDTIDNLFSFIESKISMDSISINRIADDEFEIVYHYLGFGYYGEDDISYKTSLTDTYVPNCITLTKTAHDAERIGDFFVGFHLLNSLKTGEEFFYELLETGPTPYDWYFSNYTYTLAKKMFGYDDESVIYVPANYTQMQDGLVLKLKEVPGVLDAYWENDRLVIDHDFDDDITFSPSFISSYYNDNFSDQNNLEGTSRILSYCKFPIVGLVKSVSENQVEIYTDPICEFLLTGADTMSWSDIDDFQRYCVLNPESPGYLMSLVSSDIESINDILLLTKAGYVASISNDVAPATLFYGAFSIDRYPLSILNLFFSGEDEDEEGE